MEHKYGLIVVGGGFAGTCAAIAAARLGQDVLLIEKYNCLGGAAANCLVMPFMGYSTRNPETNEKIHLAGGLFQEIVDELRAIGGSDEKGQGLDEEAIKIVLNRMCISAGVNLLFNTTVTEVKLENRKIVGIRALGKSKTLEFTADSYIDATGDAELSYLAGCRFQLGRESDNLCQPMTLCFRVSGVDKDQWRANMGRINELYKDFKARGLIKNPREDILSFNTFHDGIVHFNTTRVVRLNPTDPFDVTRAEIEAREQVYEMHSFLKEHFPGFENSRILSTALQIGIRESRMVLGEYTLNVDDLKNLARFEDAIAVGNYDIDIHNPEGAGTSHYYFGKGEWYQIPYRCLVPKDCDNMLISGRCISSTHEAQASYRIMPFCAELGQAAGAAIAIAHKNQSALRDVDIPELQAYLRDNGYMI